MTKIKTYHTLDEYLSEKEYEKIRDVEVLKKSEVMEAIEKFEEDLQEFQNFGQKSKVIIRLNQLKKSLEGETKK